MSEIQNSPNYIRIAWQSALAAGLCLGLPAGLLLWLILFQEINQSSVIEQSIVFLQVNGLNKIIVLAMCSLMWSFLLGRISGYRPWWKIGSATVVGILAGWFSPLSNLDAWFGDVTPIHVVYAVAMCGLVWIVTVCVGLSYGLILRSAKAALVLAFTTSLVSVLTLLLTIILFDQFGIRVGGTVNLAMSKVTSVSLLLAAITGGTALGVGFSRFVEHEK
jgi:hypothetical protein